MLAASLWSATPINAQPTGEIAGQVKDAIGSPLPGVTITLQGPARLVALTDGGGSFSLPKLPPGAYELTASLDGFAPAVRTLNLSAAERPFVTLTLLVRTLEQVLVTASRTGDGDVQATPLAVSVLSGTDLERSQAHTVEDVAGSAPSLTFSQNTGFSQLTIRGIGTNGVFAGSDPSSAVYIDGVYLARPAMVLADFLDLQRIEVLRGPQGTLYGRNAVGGALNLISKTPTNDLETSARFAAGDLDTLRGEARVSGPIVRGRFMGSASILRGVREGFVRDLDHPNKALGGEDVTAARGKLHVVFNSRSNLLLSADLTRQEGTPLTYAKVLAVKPGFQVDNPPDLHEIRASTIAESRNLQYGTAARFTMQLAPETTLTSLTAFRQLDYDVLADTDITELDLVASRVHEIHHQMSEEITISRRRPGLTWIGGLFLFGDVDRQPTSIRFGGPRLENRIDPTVEASTGAIFGQTTIALTRRLSATGGLRYTRERKTIVNAAQFYTLDPPAVAVPDSGFSYTDAMSHEAWTPKAGLELRGEHTLAYVSATRGFKSGGFNASSPEAGRGYAPEWAWSYEGGLKSTVARGRARVNLAVFQTDYTDLQVQIAIRPGVLDISNAAAATIRGLELEGATELSREWHVGGHLTWLDARYDRYVAVGVGGVTGNVAGHRLSNAPAWSGRLWVEWDRDLGPAGALLLRADSRWQTTVFFTPFNDAIQRQRPYCLLDVTAELGPRHRPWSIGIYARNLTNEDYITGTFSSPPPAIGGRPGSPRHVGIQLVLRK
jgi:iron complex outermembrane receptor protein